MEFIANYFGVKKQSSFYVEILGGVTNYLATVYVLNTNVFFQAGFCQDCGTLGSNATSPTGYTSDQFRAVPMATALAAGLSTLLMGLFANMPILLAPGIAAIDMGILASVIGSFSNANGANLICGCIILLFGVFSTRIKIIGRTPEDYRLGVSGGIGAFFMLIALRQCGLVNFSGSYNAFFDYNVILSLLGFYVLIMMQGRDFIRVSFISSIVIVTVCSLIIRGATGESILDPTTFVDSIQLSSIVGVPAFDQFTPNNAFILGQYIFKVTINTIVDIVASVTAIILTMVITKLGYNKERFSQVLGESTKCAKIFTVIGVSNVIIAPFLGIAPVVAYTTSHLGIIVGARTGLASVVTGILFLFTALFAAPIASIIPQSATGPSFFLSCVPALSALRYLDYDSPIRLFPSLIAVFMMCFTLSIPVGVAYSFMLLFACFASSKEWRKITAQMVATFLLLMLLLLVETNVVADMLTLGVLFGSFSVLLIVCSLLMWGPLQESFHSSSGLNSGSDTLKVVEKQKHSSKAVLSSNSPMSVVASQLSPEIKTSNLEDIEQPQPQQQ